MIARKPLKAVSEKLKKCAVQSCRTPFVPRESFQTWCGPDCALALLAAKEAKKRVAIEKIERRAIKAAKERIKSRADYLKDAQQAFNAWVRERDAGLPCISCGRHHDGQYHAGHYRTVGGNPALRFEPLNCWKQCAPCNNHKSGDIVNYRLELVRRIGADRVEWLEGKHDAKRYTIDELKTLIADYRARLRELKRARA